MFLLPVLCRSVKITSLKVSDIGLYNLNIDEGSKFKLNIKNKTAFFYGKLKENAEFFKNETEWNLPNHKTFNVVPEGNYSINIKAPQNMSFWVINSSTCSKAIYLQAEKSMRANLTTVEDSTCLFVQSHFSDILISLKNFKNASFEFYNSLKMSEAKVCQNKDKCNYKSKTQFFVKVNNPLNESFIIDYKINDPALEVLRCSVEGNEKVVQGEILCGLMKNYNSLTLTGIVSGSIILAIIILLAFFKLFGLSICPSNESVRFESLKKDPYVSQLDKPNEETPAAAIDKESQQN